MTAGRGSGWPSASGTQGNRVRDTRTGGGLPGGHPDGLLRWQLGQVQSKDAGNRCSCTITCNHGHLCCGDRIRLQQPTTPERTTRAPGAFAQSSPTDEDCEYLCEYPNPLPRRLSDQYTRAQPSDVLFCSITFLPVFVHKDHFFPSPLLSLVCKIETSHKPTQRRNQSPILFVFGLSPSLLWQSSGSPGLCFLSSYSGLALQLNATSSTYKEEKKAR